MYCPNCKREFDGKFCPECGTKLVERTTRICPNCNVEVESKFCPECGAKTVEVVEKMVKMCPNCKVETESKFCPECGAKIVEMAVKATATGEIVAAGQQEDAETCYRTAQDYYYGNNGKQKDDEAAAQWYLKAAEQGHLESLYCLGNMLKEVCEFEDAFGCFQQAAEHGHAAAQYELGVAYSLGFGTEQDDEESMKWYRKAAEQGHKEAIDFLEEQGERVTAETKKKNNETSKTKKTAKAENAAAENDVVACYNTAMEYHLGTNGKKKNNKKAVEWYQKAAEMGLAEAQVQLAKCYMAGCGVKRDLDLTFEWYHKAAEQGNGWAQYALGHLYGHSFNPPNYPEMKKWYKKAEEQGVSELPGLPKPLSPEAMAKAAELQAAGTKVTVEKKNNKPTETKNLKQKEEPKISIKSLIETITVTNTSNGEDTWEFGEYDDLEPLYTHLSSYCNCPEELQEKEMTITEIRDYLEKRRGHDFLVTIIKYANFLQLGEEDWDEFESWFVNDYSLYGKYAVKCRVGNEVIEKTLNLSSTIRNMKFIHCISNFRVKDEDGNELVDTREQAWEALDRLTSVLERVGADTLPLDEYLDNDDAEGVLENEDCDDILKEIVKFACALSIGEEAQVDDDGLFETPDNFNEATCYEIYFPDANRYTCCWP